jgi:hypothetical protein
MNTEKSLKNRIRDWSPQQPKLPQTSAGIGLKAEQLPPPKPPRISVALTANDEVMTLCWTAVGGMLIFATIMAVIQQNVALIPQVISIVAGLTVCGVPQIIVTKRLLSKLAANNG